IWSTSNLSIRATAVSIRVQQSARSLVFVVSSFIGFLLLSPFRRLKHERHADYIITAVEGAQERLVLRRHVVAHRRIPPFGAVDDKLSPEHDHKPSRRRRVAGAWPPANTPRGRGTIRTPQFFSPPRPSSFPLGPPPLPAVNRAAGRWQAPIDAIRRAMEPAI